MLSDWLKQSATAEPLYKYHSEESYMISSFSSDMERLNISAEIQFLVSHRAHCPSLSHSVRILPLLLA